MQRSGRIEPGSAIELALSPANNVDVTAFVALCRQNPDLRLEEC